MRIESRLTELGIAIPAPTEPGGHYVPSVLVGDMVYIAGQVPRLNGRVAFVGKVGRELDMDQAQAAAQLCALNVLAQLKVACDGDLDRVVRCVRLNGFVNCTPEFAEQPTVVNGASDLLMAVFGDSGRHVRTAIGVNALPGGAACEIESLFQIRLGA